MDYVDVVVLCTNRFRYMCLKDMAQLNKKNNDLKLCREFEVFPTLQFLASMFMLSTWCRHNAREERHKLRHVLIPRLNESRLKLDL